MHRFYLFFFAIILIPYTLSAQAKKPLDEVDVQRWRKIEREQISNDGQWVAWVQAPVTEGDPALYLWNARTGATTVFPRSTEAAFSEDCKLLVFKIKPALDTLKAQRRRKVKDENGNVLIKGFYDDVIPLTAEEKKAIASVPDAAASLKKELGVATPDGNGESFLELLNKPTLNINGIQSANAGALASNIIPAKAEATLDLRLVPGNDANRQVQKVKDYIASKGYHIIDNEPTAEERMQYGHLIKITSGKGYNAQRTPMNLPAAQSLIKAVQSTVDYPLILKPSLGGSLPLFLFEKYLDAKVVTVPIVNYDNNQHAENENVQLKFLWEGIETAAAIIMMD